MSKKTKDLFEAPTPESVEVSIEYEANPEKPNTVESVMNAKIEIKVEKPKEEPAPVDPKVAILNEFAELMRVHGKHGLVDVAIGEQLWRLWQKFTGRTDRFRKCSSCLVPKVQRLIRECKAHNISIF